MPLFLGVDAGSRSVRAGLFDTNGRCVAHSESALNILVPSHDFAEYRSSDIWSAVIRSVRDVLEQTDCQASDVKGIGFDATCSLVGCKVDGTPTSLSPTGDNSHDTIVWMDHRALAEADEINRTRHDVLKNVGGRISPEMQIPKLLWLKRHMPEAFAAVDRFFDLPDWLTFKATNHNARSVCSAVCKWTYQADQGLEGQGWDRSFFETVGLDSLLENEAVRIGNRFQTAGSPIGQGLSAKAASELGLASGTPVGSSLIDAYAGAVGTMLAGEKTIGSRMALIAGTSACHIIETLEPNFINGVWGPYLSAMTKSHWALEAGQSAAGALIDRLIEGHSAARELREAAKTAQVDIHTLIADRLVTLAGDAEVYALTRDLHVNPDFHGNRSPLADFTRLGAISGLNMFTGADDLCCQVLATIQALAYGTRHIVDQLNKNSVEVDAIVVSGGLSKNSLYVQSHADALGLPIIIPEQNEPVLAGAAMLGSTAAGFFPNLKAAMASMSGNAETVLPRSDDARRFHDDKYAVFRRMQVDFKAYQNLMRP